MIYTIDQMNYTELNSVSCAQEGDLTWARFHEIEFAIANRHSMVRDILRTKGVELERLVKLFKIEEFAVCHPSAFLNQHLIPCFLFFFRCHLLS